MADTLKERERGGRHFQEWSRRNARNTKEIELRLPYSERERRGGVTAAAALEGSDLLTACNCGASTTINL